jgi:DNA repair protein RadC
VAVREGHRARLRARYRLSGETALQDYELLELLLTYAIPCRDTKLIANRLFDGPMTLAPGWRPTPQLCSGLTNRGP